MTLAIDTCIGSPAFGLHYVDRGRDHISLGRFTGGLLVVQWCKVLAVDERI